MQHILFVVIIFAIVLYLVNNYIPMTGKIKQIVNVAAVVLLILWLLGFRI
jgi:hypothetical protein